MRKTEAAVAKVSLLTLQEEEMRRAEEDSALLIYSSSILILYSSSNFGKKRDCNKRRWGSV